MRQKSLAGGLVAAILIVLLPSPAARPAAPAVKAAAPAVRAITFPIEGPVSFRPDYGACRDGCSRRHQGNDVFADKGSRLVSTVAGTVVDVRVQSGNAGNLVKVRDAAGWVYYYFHLNNDTPGTDDGRNPPQHRFGPGIAVGARVQAGQLIGYVGDSGNAENTPPHLHFEIRTPGNTPIDPRESLVRARATDPESRCDIDRNPVRTPEESLATDLVATDSTGELSSDDVPVAGGRSGPLNAVALAPRSRGGSWLLRADGSIESDGGAPPLGNLSGRPLFQPVVDIASTPTGDGYWVVAADGGVFTFGDAPYLGGLGGVRLNQPVVGISPTASGQGYWLVAADGGIFTFGDARFAGSAGSIKLRQPIVDMAPTPEGRGYWLLASDGGVFTYGGARYSGSLPGGSRCFARAVALVPTPSGTGYWVLTEHGRTLAFGDAPDARIGALRLGAGERAVDLVVPAPDGVAEPLAPPTEEAPEPNELPPPDSIPS